MNTADPLVPYSRSQIALLAGLSLSMLLSSLGTSIANVGLPTLAQAFDAPFQQVQWVVLAYLLTITTLIVSVGRLGDLIGRRRLMLAGILVFTAASALCGAAPGLNSLIAARAVQGVGAAAMMALTMAFASEAAPKGRTGSVMGVLGTMTAVGTALGPALGGALIAASGWRSLFLINLPLGVAALWLAYRHLPADGVRSSGGRPRFDSLGTLLLASTLAAYALAMTLGRGHVWWLNAGLLGAAAVGAGLFVRVQSKAASPLIRLALFRQPEVSAGLASNALVATVMMATLVVGPFYLAGALGLDAAMVGLVMSCGPAVAAFTGVPAGRAVDRYGAHRMAVAGLIGMTAGAAVLPVAAQALGVAGYVGLLAVITSGYALFQAANGTAVMTAVAPEQRGVASGLLNLARNLGLVTGASAMGAAFVFASGVADTLTAAPAALAAGLRGTFGVATALVLTALLATVAGQRRARRGALRGGHDAA